MPSGDLKNRANDTNLSQDFPKADVGGKASGFRHSGSKLNSFADNKKTSHYVC